MLNCIILTTDMNRCDRNEAITSEAFIYVRDLPLLLHWGDRVLRCMCDMCLDTVSIWQMSEV